MINCTNGGVRKAARRFGEDTAMSTGCGSSGSVEAGFEFVKFYRFLLWFLKILTRVLLKCLQNVLQPSVALVDYRQTQTPWGEVMVMGLTAEGV